MKKYTSHQDITFRQIAANVIKDPEYFRVRLIAIIAVGIGFITIFHNSISFSCVLSIIQNFVLVVFATKELMRLTTTLTNSQRIKTGSLFGLFMGTFSAAINIAISNIRYYLWGYRELAYIAKNQVITNITIQDVLIGLWSDFFIFCILVAISAFAGLFVAVISRISNEEKN